MSVLRGRAPYEQGNMNANPGAGWVQGIQSADSLLLYFDVNPPLLQSLKRA